MVPITTEPFDSVAYFNTAQSPGAIVGTCSTYLKIITPEKLGEIFNQKIYPLRYSPRKMLIHPLHTLIILESSHHAYNENEKKALKEKLIGNDPEAMELPEKNYGGFRAPVGRWASCIRLVDTIPGETLDLLELENNEAAISMSLISFLGQENEIILVVGTVKDMILQPKSFTMAYIHAYGFTDQAKKLTLLHKTAVEDIPYCFAEFHGKLLAGIGTNIRLYELGKKKLLKKAELKGFHSGVNSLQVMGNRIFATDLSDSVHVLKYRNKEQTFFEYADDILPRWISTICVVDNRTVFAADKFESIFVIRLPERNFSAGFFLSFADIDEEIDEDPFSYKFKWESGYLNGAPYKVTAF